MLKRIDLFMPTSGQYGALHYFTARLNATLQEIGIKTRLLTIDPSNPGLFLNQLLSDPPDCTLAFNGALPDSQGRFLCDLVKIPHVAWLVDSPSHFLPLVKSPYNIIICIDRFFCEEFKEIASNHVAFLPLAAEIEVVTAIENERKYDVLLLASYIDHEEIFRSWEKEYPSSVLSALLSAAELTLADERSSNRQVLINCLQKEDAIDQIDFSKLLKSFENYLRGLERVRLVQSIGDIQVDIFGSGNTKAIWNHHLCKDNQVVIHEPVSFEQSIELMKNSKIVLNSCAWIKNGAHDRIFTGMASGALVLTRENPYLSEYFVNQDSLLTYRGSQMRAIKETIQKILHDEKHRRQIATKSKDITLEHHTWKHRAVALVEEINRIL